VAVTLYIFVERTQEHNITVHHRIGSRERPALPTRFSL
jgi:hypothetical protein